MVSNDAGATFTTLLAPPPYNTTTANYTVRHITADEAYGSLAFCMQLQLRCAQLLARLASTACAHKVAACR
jgi:hypothetical protein